MKYLKLFESYRRSMDNLTPIDVENYIYEWVDSGQIDLKSCEYVDAQSDPDCVTARWPVGYHSTNLFNDEPLVLDPTHFAKTTNWWFNTKKTIKLVFEIFHPTNRVRGNLDVNGYIKSMNRHHFKRIHDHYNVNIFCRIRKSNQYDDVMGEFAIIIQERPPHMNESVQQTDSTLLIVDVQKSFKKFFNDLYLNELKKYSATFKNVIQIFDNHVDGKNVDKDYLYDPNEEAQTDHPDVYDFPNQVDVIEKRYNYDVDADFYRKILSKETHDALKKQENNLKKGQYFPTKEGTIIVYVGNRHRWFHVPRKLYDLFVKYKGKEITVVGGSDLECLEDVVTAGEALGVKMKRDWRYIYSATHCPF